MGICVYCGEAGKPTKEEVMPLFLSDNRPEYRTIVDHYRGKVRRGRITAVKDVCADLQRRDTERFGQLRVGA